MQIHFTQLTWTTCWLPTFYWRPLALLCGKVYYHKYLQLAKPQLNLLTIEIEKSTQISEIMLNRLLRKDMLLDKPTETLHTS